MTIMIVSHVRTRIGKGDKILLRIDVSNVKVEGFEAAIRGMRNSRMNHDQSDSYTTPNGEFIIGPKDLELAQRLCRTSSSERKFMRMINMTADIEAAMSFWHDFDTYKVGTVVNSESRINWLHKNKITLEKLGLEEEKITGSSSENYLKALEVVRKTWISRTDKEEKRYYFNLLTTLLPAGYRQKRTVCLAYETIFAIYWERKGHILYEFEQFCGLIRTLPYAKELIFGVFEGV